MFKIGTAAWNIPRAFAGNFPSNGSHLQRYSSVLNAVEINTSFYREHKATTYQKWHDEVPENFCFSVKLYRYFTQEMRLRAHGTKLKQNLLDIMELGPKLAVLLVQLPPSLSFVSSPTQDFFSALRDVYQGPVAFEPRHMSWNIAEALEVQKIFSLARVIADPDPCGRPSEVNNLHSLEYYRLHGSPEIYRSDYSSKIPMWQKRLELSAQQDKNVWCIFDNTTFGYATLNAVAMQRRLLNAIHQKGSKTLLRLDEI